MLESVVARLLNQLLGKYVVDLDTENLNVGIFSGQVQLKDLQLKVEALYELGLPIKVKVGTIGQIWLKIPWNYLWNDPVVVNIEDIHIIAEPIISSEEFNPETDKRLIRALKKTLLSSLDKEKEFIGGPQSFSEHLLTNIINHLQLNITNVHIRYEDNLSAEFPLACGLCIGSITAETTNNKWKACKTAKNAEICYYLIKIEALSTYWNPNYKPRKWDIPSQYYIWRNAMSSSLQNFSMNDEDFEFILKPMTTKVKMTISRTNNGDIAKIVSDIVVQDCNIQVSQKQYHSILAVQNSFHRMFISWNFLYMRPKQSVLKNKKIWWKYAYHAMMEQRVRPNTWSRIRKVRLEYKQYCEAYKQILLNPNDTELKLDLQKYEDCLSIINIVIGRRQANLKIKECSLSDKSFWSMLPSPERSELCKKIGFPQKDQEVKQLIEHKHNFRMGNVSITLTNSGREILVVTLTQIIWSILPNIKDSSYKTVFKIEGIVIEGASIEDHLVPILSSEHNADSPAYFLKIEVEKMPAKSNISYKINGSLSTVEILYQQYALNELQKYVKNEFYSMENVYPHIEKLPNTIFNLIDNKISQKWNFNFNIAIPYVIFCENGKMQKGNNVLILDFGHLCLKTEICEKNDVSDTTTQMELEEQFYSRLHIELNDSQILFGDMSETWKESKKEKNTDVHILSKTNLSATFASCIKTLKTIPKYKFNTNIPSLKINISERNLVSLLIFFNGFINNNASVSKQPSRATLMLLKKIKNDNIKVVSNSKYLRHIYNTVQITRSRVTTRKKPDRNGIVSKEKRRMETAQRKENMNEAWARVVDLPGLEDNISPNNNISTLLRLVITELSLTFSRSSDITDRAYLMFRLGSLMMDVALMTYGPAYQMSLNNILLTDKLYTNSSGQYLDLIYSPFPSKIDVLTILYRKVDASCPDFWTHFHGVETSLVADVGTLNLLLHQDALHTIIKYTRYMYYKVQSQISEILSNKFKIVFDFIKKGAQSKRLETPVPPGAVKFSHSAHLTNLQVRVCDADFDIVNVEFSGLEMDFLFRANERFVFRSFLSNLTVEHLSDGTLYSKVVTTDQDKVFEIKYVRHAPHLIQKNDISPSHDDTTTDGSFKFQLGRIHVTFLYKLIVQLQRFIVNLEAIPFIQNTINLLQNALTKATDTLKASTKVHLAINIRGPILLFPQRSDSPNVVIFDTGELTVENFFKEYPNEMVENILVKLIGITILRGVMTLTSNLEMQETIVEPLSLHLDVKRFITQSKTVIKPLSWDIDGAIDTIQINLGQRDLSVILAIYVDNIGEGKLMDLIPETIISPTANDEVDNTVKTLEAFFCEPKQKDISIKFSLDTVNLILFFDSGELLSSPIRDLNHGLCKFEICDVFTSTIIYTDFSLDGKLSVDCILVEELGLDVNTYDKRILHSPADNNKNNNCNITVNNPPIIDVTFHQNKNGDKSVDVIVGRLSLCLSVPFCEKIALFVLECLPKENIDLGIINHGYIGDLNDFYENSTTAKSFTIALRINKPEFIFNVETTSNKKRYFITESEILSDYSRHNNRVNLAISLSGFHTLFYDLGMTSSAPYVVLKRCDVEFSKTSSEEKGDKITTTVSSLCIQLCDRVVHSINDILNDVVEHFKIPEVVEKHELKTTDGKTNEADLWESKKLSEHIIETENDFPDSKISHDKVHEVFLVPKTEIVVVLELDEIPAIIIRSTLQLSVCDWSSLLNSTCEMTVQANYYNENLQNWEPIIDPVVVNENEFVPWDILIKVFQDKSLPILNTAEIKTKKEYSKTRKKSASTSSTEDDESKEEMVYLEPPKMFYNFNNRGIKTSLSTFLDESDSENEDGAMEKLASAISDLFTGDWNESEESDFERSSDEEEDSDENLETKVDEDQASIEQIRSFKKSTYFLIEAKETLNITVNPAFLKVLNEIITLYSSKTLSISTNSNFINLINDIGPKSVLELYENRSNDDAKANVLIHTKAYENEDSCPNSPSKLNYLSSEFIDETNDDNDSLTEELMKLDLSLSYDYDITDSLLFPMTTTSILYDKIQKHYLKMKIPGFLPLQSNCPRKTWQKFMRLKSTAHEQPYHLIAKHTIGKHGRTVIVSSPLQIRNETCFALSVLYQPSVLQQLNLEPVGDVTNPFETTMRIAVLEPHEHYNVPLYIAYHCKLFIQPAYAEGHYVSEEGLWWKDLATELDVPHHLTCKPKTKSNVELFALKVLLKRNMEMKNLRSHSIPNFIIHLLPPLTFQNFLPYTLEIQNLESKQLVKVDPGEKSSIYSINFAKDQKFVLKVSYSNMIWSGTLNLTKDLDEKIVLLSTDDKINGASKQLPINIKTERENNYNLLFYASYWIINKTELPLQIRATTNNIVYESSNEDVLLFTFKRHTKQSITLKVYESSWSNDFGLDCAGTTGLVLCKDHERKKRYSFLLSIRLSQICPQYTKVVTFLPSFIVANNTKKCLRFMEHNEKTDLWIDLPSYQYKIFWPETSSMEMYVKYRDSKLSSQAFFISMQHHTVLRMDKGSALSVDVTGGISGPFHVTFNEYKFGDAPILVKNMCADLFLKIQQSGQSQVTLLNPFTCLMYTWDDPIKPRQLMWNVYNNKGSGFFVDIFKDGFGEEKINFHSVPSSSLNVNKNSEESSTSEDSDTLDSVKTTLNRKVRRDKIAIYWICYNEGLQKVLLFTQEQRTFNLVMKNYFTKLCKYEYLCSFSGIGISIFAKNGNKESAYLSLNDAPAIWEVNVGHKWKTLTLELASWIENKYKFNYKKCQLKDYIHIDFEKMFMLKPFFAELRRSYNPALYFIYRKSRDNQYFNLKIQSLQIDNKQSTSNESILLHPLPPVNIKSPAPLIELVAFKNTHKDCHIYKDLHFNIEEFHIHLDSDFIHNISELFEDSFKLREDLISLYRSEMALIHTPLAIVSKDIPSCNTKIENLRVGQLSVQLNISSRNRLECRKNTVFLTNVLNYIFPINSAPYMPAEGIRHRIIPLELTHVKGNLKEILLNVWQSTKSQFLQQYYSQVLGLQVLVNTYSVQPIPCNENALSDCEKMANLLLSGYRCMLGHLNMSPAALEQCATEIFTNQSIDSIQRIRRHSSYLKTATIPKSIMASARNFDIGVTLALEQLITDNGHNGMHYDGEVFFRGTGKALFSLITRHPDEKCDSVQIAVEALRRASILGEPVRIHQRLTRYYNPHLGVRPFSVYESMGYYLLETIANNRFAEDTYWAHATVDKIGKSIIIISLEHVMRINKCRLWGPWEIEWVLELDDIVSVPQLETSELVINVRQEENKFSNSSKKISVAGNKEMLIWIKEKIEQAIVVSMEDKSWTVNE